MNQQDEFRWKPSLSGSSVRIADVPDFGRLMVKRSAKAARTFDGYIAGERVGRWVGRDAAISETAKIARQRLAKGPPDPADAPQASPWSAHSGVMAAASPVQELLHIRADVVEVQTILVGILERIARLLPHVKKDAA